MRDTTRSDIVLAQLTTMKVQLQALGAARETDQVPPRKLTEGTSTRGLLNPSSDAPRKGGSIVLPAFSVPMTAAQKQLWIMSMLSEQGSSACNLCSVLRSDIELDIERVTHAIDALMPRHPLLRSKPDEDGEHLVSFSLEPSPAPVKLVIFNASSEATAQDILGVEACRSFDIADGPLFRFVLVRHLARSYLMLVAHHIIVDGRTCQLLLEDFAAQYDQRAFQSPSREDQARVMTLYKAWLHESLDSALQSGAADYWKNRFSQPVPPASFRQAAPETGDAYAAISRRFELSAVVALVDQASRRAKVSRFMFMTAAFARLLHRISGAEQLLIGIPIARTPPQPLATFITCATDIGLIKSRWNSQTSPTEHLRVVASDILSVLDLPGFGYAEALDRNLVPIESPISAMITLERAVSQDGDGTFDLQPAPPAKRSFQGISMVIHENGPAVSCELTVQLSVASADILDTFERELPLLVSVLAAEIGDAG